MARDSNPERGEVSLDQRLDTRNAVGLTWIGQVKEGQPNVTLTGTAEEIVQQILAANPDYEFPTLSSNKTQHAVQVRQGLNPPPPTKSGTRDNSVATSDDDWLLV